MSSQPHPGTPVAALTNASLSRRRLLQAGAGAGLAASLGLSKNVTIAQEGNAVSLIIASNPASWDLTLSTWTTWQGVTFLYDRLLWADEEENLLPLLCTEWSLSDDGLTYSLTLQEGVNFHDGTPFNAEAVKFNMERFKNEPDSAFFTVYDPIDTIEVVDDTHLTITLREVRPNFAAEGFAQWGALQLSPTAYAEGAQAFAEHPIGTGPFVFESYEPGSEIRYRRNEEYWGDVPIIDQVIVRVVPEPAVQLIELESGNVDISQIQAKDIEPMEALGLNITSNITPGSQMVSLNVSKAPTSELAVRKAIALAMDRDAMIESVLYGQAEKSRGGVNSASIFYSEDIPLIEYNMEEAGRILDEAGWVMGDGGVRARDGEPLSVNILSSDFQLWGLFNQIIQEQLTQLGFASEIKSLEWNAMLDEWRENQGDWNVSFHSQGAIMARTEPIQASWVPNDFWNINQIDDAEDPDLIAVAEELQAINDEFQVTIDEEARKELAVRAQILYYEHQLTVWLWHAATITATSPRVQNLEFSHAGRIVELTRATVEA